MTCAVPQESWRKPGQRQFLGDDIAAQHRAAFQHQTAIAGLGEIGRRHQAVVAGAGHDDVETVGHVRLFGDNPGRMLTLLSAAI